MYFEGTLKQNLEEFKEEIEKFFEHIILVEIDNNPKKERQN